MMFSVNYFQETRDFLMTYGDIATMTDTDAQRRSWPQAPGTPM
jgi:hypothetical protein